MKRFKCRNCDALFDEPETESACIGEAWGRLISEDYYKCPYCGSYDLDYDEDGFEEDDFEEEEDVEQEVL